MDDELAPLVAFYKSMGYYYDTRSSRFEDGRGNGRGNGDGDADGYGNGKGYGIGNGSGRQRGRGEQPGTWTDFGFYTECGRRGLAQLRL